MPMHYSLRILQYVLIAFTFAWLLYAYIFSIHNAPSWVILESLVIAAICAVSSGLVAVIRRYLRKRPRSESDFIVP
jgi:hypothetical protein